MLIFFLLFMYMYVGFFFFIYVEIDNKNGCNIKFNFVVLKIINNINIVCCKIL